MSSLAAQRWKTAISRVTNQPLNMGSRTTQCASKIRERLYLSDYWTANDEAGMRMLGITHIISVIDRLTRPLPAMIPESNQLLISIADRSDVDILIHLEDTTNFIIEALAESGTNKVLVHCAQGISRSATVVCAYLIATEGLAAHEALDNVQSSRNVVCPNLGFRLQLLQYSERFPKRQRASKASHLPKEFIQRLRKLLSPGVAVEKSP